MVQYGPLCLSVSLTTYVPEHDRLMEEAKSADSTHFLNYSRGVQASARRSWASVHFSGPEFSLPWWSLDRRHGSDPPLEVSGGEWSSGVTSAGLDAGPPHDNQRLSRKADSLFESQLVGDIRRLSTVGNTPILLIRLKELSTHFLAFT